MKVTYSGETYECDVAVKCENDNYIKLYDSNGVEIVSFMHISDFSKYKISGGSFTAPCDCAIPIQLTTYVIGGRIIQTSDWILNDEGYYYYEIENNLISSNETTCNITIFFKCGTKLNYSAKQEEGKITLFVKELQTNDISIENIQITRI